MKPVLCSTKGLSIDRTAESTVAGISWVQFARARNRFRDRWPSLWRLRVERDPIGFVAGHANPATILDVGATDRLWEGPIRRQWRSSDYRSLDIDRTNTHDYHDFDDVDRQFDLVMCLEVLEHVVPADAVSIARACARATTPRGFVVASVPNVYRPGTPFEFTHATHFHTNDLGGLLIWCGLEVVDAARLFLGPSRTLLKHRLVFPLHRSLGVDYCQSIIVLARKPA